MSEKHYPYIGGSFDRIVFDGDGSVWVPEPENAKLRELVRDMHAVISDRNSWWDCMYKDTRRFADRMRELGVEVEL